MATGGPFSRDVSAGPALSLTLHHAKGVHPVKGSGAGQGRADLMRCALASPTPTPCRLVWVHPHLAHGVNVDQDLSLSLCVSLCLSLSLSPCLCLCVSLGLPAHLVTFPLHLPRACPLHSLLGHKKPRTGWVGWWVGGCARLLQVVPADF